MRYRTLVTGSADKMLKFWSTRSDQSGLTLTCTVPSKHSDWICCTSIDHVAGMWATSASRDGSIKIWSRSSSSDNSSSNGGGKSAYSAKSYGRSSYSSSSLSAKEKQGSGTHLNTSICFAEHAYRSELLYVT
jgi:WD40 repeat protein